MPENKTNNSNAETGPNEFTAHAMRVARTTDSAVHSDADGAETHVGGPKETKKDSTVASNEDAETGSDVREVSPADVDWIDHYGSALIHGFRFTPGDIAAFEHHRDRDHTGRLNLRAKERIARILTCELDKRADLWRRAREAYRAERLSEGVTEPASFQGPADTGISARTGDIAPAQRKPGTRRGPAGAGTDARVSSHDEADGHNGTAAPDPAQVSTQTGDVAD